MLREKGDYTECVGAKVEAVGGKTLYTIVAAAAGREGGRGGLGGHHRLPNSFVG